jgi:lambda family phage portal protein
MAARLKPEANWLDRAISYVAPARALNRVRARTHLSMMLRHYEAAQPGRRTSGWKRSGADVNAANGPALVALRELTRDLIRNNSWARNGKRVIQRHTVGWGITPKAADVDDATQKRTSAIWKRWAGTTECDAEGRRNFYGLQKMVMGMAVESGEALIRRRWRRPSDGLSLPLQLQLLEPDFLDTSKDGMPGTSGGRVIQGVEFDAIGRRSGYWLFDEHPGSLYHGRSASRLVPVSDIIHVFDDERPGQVRAVPWFTSAITNLKDFDEYEDGTIMRQKIAALFAAFITDPTGEPEEFGEESEDDDRVEEFEPGMIKYLGPGQKVEFTSPPLVTNDGFSARTLRRIGAGLGVTYEDLTGDYSQVNYSSARMARLAHWGNVYDWQWNMLIPQFCDGGWAWAMEAAVAAGRIAEAPLAEWTTPPMPMIDPDKEGLAYTRRVRSGQMTPSEMVREQGKDPAAHWAEYAADMELLDKLKIWLDSDVRRVSAAGLTQERVGGKAEEGGAGEQK